MLAQALTQPNTRIDLLACLDQGLSGEVSGGGCEEVSAVGSEAVSEACQEDTEAVWDNMGAEDVTSIMTCMLTTLVLIK